MLRILLISVLLFLQAEYAMGVYVHNCMKLQKSRTFLGNSTCKKADEQGKKKRGCCKKPDSQENKTCKVEVKHIDSENQLTDYSLKRHGYTDNLFCTSYNCTSGVTWVLAQKKQQAITFYDTSPPLIYTTERYKFVCKFTI